MISLLKWKAVQVRVIKQEERKKIEDMNNIKNMELNNKSNKHCGKREQGNGCVYRQWHTSVPSVELMIRALSKISRPLRAMADLREIEQLQLTLLLIIPRLGFTWPHFHLLAVESLLHRNLHLDTHLANG